MNFRNIIIPMLLALVGLIAFQWYWIKNAIDVKKEQFDRDVYESMQAAIRQIEKQEVIFLTQKQLKIQKEKELLAKNIAKTSRKTKDTIPFQSHKTVLQILVDKKPTTPPADYLVEGQIEMELPPQPLMKIEEEMPAWEFPHPNVSALEVHQKNIQAVSEMIDRELEGWEKRRRRISPNESFNKVSKKHISDKKWLWMNGNILSEHSKDDQYLYINIKQNPSEDSVIWEGESRFSQIDRSIEIPKKNTGKPFHSSLERTQNKAALVKDVLTNAIQVKRAIGERLNRAMLDTLLKKEFQNRGITIPYEYGVKSQSNMLFSSFSNNISPELLNNAYKVLLFPNDIQPQSHFLYVMFPDTKGFILKNLWLIFLSSLLLILMVGGVFYGSIQTMYKQKELADIKNDFINNMTHEFKTPISTISLAVEVMKDKEMGQDSSKLNRYLTIIQDENSRLGMQVEKVLQMALLDKGEVKLRLEKINIHEVIEQVLTNLAVQIESKSGIVHLELNAKQPEMYADEVHLTNIIFNLLDNAIKYSPENLAINISTETNDNMLTIRISDKGIGMTNDQLARIFEKFYRVPTGNVHDVKGFGLGLSYVKKMVELHGGQVAVQSKPGVGTTFEVFFEV